MRKRKAGTDLDEAWIQLYRLVGVGQSVAIALGLEVSEGAVAIVCWQRRIELDGLAVQFRRLLVLVRCAGPTMPSSMKRFVLEGHRLTVAGQAFLSAHGPIPWNSWLASVLTRSASAAASSDTGVVVDVEPAMLPAIAVNAVTEN